MADIDKGVFLSLLARYARVDAVEDNMVLFGAGLNLSSIGFTEFILELEEINDINIDIDDLDNSIRTVGQLWERLSR